MKLHLPKTLLVAVLAACVAPTAWAAITGPATNYAEGTLPTFTDNAGSMTVTQDTAWDLQQTTKKTLTITAKDDSGENTVLYGIKLSGAQNTNNAENYLENVVASSVWFANGSFQIDKATDLSSAGDIYVGGGQVQLTRTMTLSNKFVLGGTSVSTGFAALNTSLRLGQWTNGDVAQNQVITLSGTVEAKENTSIGFQEKAHLNISGTLTGSGNIALSLYNGASSLTLSAQTSTYTGYISSTATNITLKLGASAVQLGGLSGSFAVGLADGTTASALTLKVGEGKNLTYSGLLSSEIDLIKDGAGTQILSGDRSLGSVSVTAGKLSLTGAATLGNTTVADTASLVISKAATLTGTLSGKLTIETLEGFEGEGSYTGGNTEGNGYFGGDYQIINGSNKAGVSIGYGGNTYTTNEEGSINTTDYSTFHINTGTEAISTAKGKAATNTIEMANGTTLTVDADFATVRTADGATAVALTVNNATDTNPTITTLSAAGAGVTVGGTSGLSITSATAGTLTANADIDLGANKHEVGALVINDGATVTTTHDGDAENGSAFVKSVTINGGGTLQQTGDNLSAFGQGTGKMGSLTIGGGEKVAKLLLTNRNAIDSTTLTLNGNTLIGSAGSTGAVTDASEDGTNTQYRDNRAILDFIGDNKVAVSGTNNTIDAALRLRGGKTTFEVTNSTEGSVTTEGTIVLNGNIFEANNTDGTFTKSGDGKLTIASDTAGVHKAEVTGGTLEIAGGKTLAAAGTMTVGAAGTLALSSVNAFSVTGALTFEEGAKLSYTLSTMPAAESGDISYTLGTAGSIIGVDTLIYTGSVMEGYTAKLSTVAGTGSTQNLVLTFEQNAITLTETRVTEVLGFADGVLTLKTDVSANKYVFGDTFNVNITDDLWEMVIAEVEPEYADAFSITMQDASGTVLNFGTATPTVVFNGQVGDVLPTTAGTAGTYAIPEPTTATLSLLALAALAARRRRK